MAALSEDTGQSYIHGHVCFYSHVLHLNSFCLQNSLDVTETFKQQKTKLVQEAFKPHVSQDPLYFLHAAEEDYIALTASLYHSILSGEILL